MGWDTRRIEIVVHVSRHNSENDKRDDDLLDEMETRIKEVVEDPKYKLLNPMIV